jgi:hypothetical protein
MTGSMEKIKCNNHKRKQKWTASKYLEVKWLQTEAFTILLCIIFYFLLQQKNFKVKIWTHKA